MHIWRNEYITQYIIQPAWQTDIGVRNTNGSYQQRLKYHHRIYGCTANNYAHEKEDSPQQAFHRAMAQAGSKIHIIIGMMDNMKPP